MRYRGIRPDSPDDRAAVIEIFKQRGLLEDGTSGSTRR
jgi:hypothetical protein